MRDLALEGSGDLGAAFLKNCGTDDHEHPQSGEEGEGAESCNHRVDPSLRAPNRTGHDMFQLEQWPLW